MLRRRPAASAMLAVLLVLAIGAWGTDDPQPRRVARLTVLHRAPAPAPLPAAPSAPPAPPAQPPAPTVLRETGTNDVALTFDDGPGDDTLAILDLLRQHHVKATFCLIGVHVQARPDLVQAIVRDGHTLCNHTWHHDLHLGQRPPEVIRSDLERTSEEIHRAVPGVPIKYFRQPGGVWTDRIVSIAQ